MATEKTPEPLTVDPYGSEPALRYNGGMTLVPRVFGSLDDAKRLCAAWNATLCIPVDLLKAGLVDELLDVATRLAFSAKMGDLPGPQSYLTETGRRAAAIIAKLDESEE